MADQVQFILDRMTTSLKNTEELGIFNHTEVQSIVRKRTDYEYILKRRQLEPADFYTYVKYELNLDKLLAIRSQRFEEKYITKEEKDKLRNLQTAFFKHVCYIFDRALRRFPAETTLWADYIDFLKMKNAVSVLNTVLGKAIALFPTNEDVWIEAAAHELHTNNSADAARMLLQRSLRVNKASPRLWRRYLELELWNVARISSRKKILKIEEVDEARDRLRVISAPLVVFKYAVAAIPEVDFAYELYSICTDVSQEVSESIFAEMKRVFGDKSEFWSSVAALEVGSKIRMATMPSNSTGKDQDSGDIALEEKIGDSSSEKSSLLLTKFAAISTILGSGITMLEQGMEKFGISLKHKRSDTTVPFDSAPVSSKKSKKRGRPEESPSETDTWGVLPCTDSDLLKFVDSFCSIVNVSIGGIATTYSNYFVDIGEDIDSSAVTLIVLAALKTLDAVLGDVKQLLILLIDATSKHTSACSHVACALSLLRFRVGALFSFVDFFSTKWGQSIGNDQVEEGKKKRGRKSSAAALVSSSEMTSREELYGASCLSMVELKTWLQDSIDHGSRSSMNSPALSRRWLDVADTALSCVISSVSEVSPLTVTACSINNPGNFWWGIVREESQQESQFVEDLCKVVMSAASVRFAPVEVKERTKSVTSVVKKAQGVLLEDCGIGADCEKKATVAKCLQDAIKSKYISNKERLLWICDYIKLGYGTFGSLVSVVSDESQQQGRIAYQWCINALDAMPGILFLNSNESQPQDAMDMSDVFAAVLEGEEFDSFLAELKKKGSRHIKQSVRREEKIAFLSALFQRVMKDCPKHNELVENCSEFYASIGDHKSANHLRWKKNNALSHL